MQTQTLAPALHPCAIFKKHKTLGMDRINHGKGTTTTRTHPQRSAKASRDGGSVDDDARGECASSTGRTAARTDSDTHRNEDRAGAGPGRRAAAAGDDAFMALLASQQQFLNRLSVDSARRQQSNAPHYSALCGGVNLAGSELNPAPRSTPTIATMTLPTASVARRGSMSSHVDQFALMDRSTIERRPSLDQLLSQQLEMEIQSTFDMNMGSMPPIPMLQPHHPQLQPQQQPQSQQQQQWHHPNGNDTLGNLFGNLQHLSSHFSENQEQTGTQQTPSAFQTSQAQQGQTGHDAFRQHYQQDQQTLPPRQSPQQEMLQDEDFESFFRSATSKGGAWPHKPQYRRASMNLFASIPPEPLQAWPSKDSNPGQNQGASDCHDRRIQNQLNSEMYLTESKQHVAESIAQPIMLANEWTRMPHSRMNKPTFRQWRRPNQASMSSSGVVTTSVDLRRRKIEKLRSTLLTFSDAMRKTADSQQEIHDWDRKMGLKRSHSKTMRQSSRSRKKLRSMARAELAMISHRTSARISSGQPSASSVLATAMPPGVTARNAASASPDLPSTTDQTNLDRPSHQKHDR